MQESTAGQAAGEAVEAVAAQASAVLDLVHYGNTVRVWLVALGIFAATFAALFVLRTVVVRRIARLASRDVPHADGVVVKVLRRTRLYFMLALGAGAASLTLDLSDGVREIVRIVVTLAALLQLGLWLNEAVGLWIQRVGARRAATDVASVTTINALGLLARLALWLVVFLLALETFGVDVTALIAGLGIAGIAVALAVQNVLGDLLASLAIVLDKPFVVGDFIIVDTYLGTVEEVGLKTTRLRSLSGERLIFSNADLLKARVRNYKHMVERRIVFGFGIEYGTPPERVERIVGELKEIVAAEPLARLDRAHFARFGSSALEFEVVYFVLSPEYGVYMDVQQRVNLEIMRRLEALGVRIALPTQIVHVRGQGTGNREQGTGNGEGGTGDGEQETGTPSSLVPHP